MGSVGNRHGKLNKEPMGPLILTRDKERSEKESFWHSYPKSPKVWEPNQAIEARTSAGIGGPERDERLEVKTEVGTKGAKR